MTHWYRQYATLLKESVNYPEKIDYHTLKQMVQNIHHNERDFEEGDLDHRLQKYDYYVLQSLPVNQLDADEWAHDENESDHMATMPKETMPPIVYDSMDHSIIDGTHRTNAAIKRGDSEILAYVGLEQYLDPYWDSNNYEDEED